MKPPDLPRHCQAMNITPLRLRDVARRLAGFHCWKTIGNMDDYDALPVQWCYICGTVVIKYTFVRFVWDDRQLDIRVSRRQVSTCTREILFGIHET